MIGVRDQVIRHDRDLAATAGCVDHVGGYGVAGRVAAKTFHDLEALADRCPEVSGALDEVALVQVIGPDPVRDELVHERPLDVDAVVDPGKEHALVTDGQARLGQLVDRARDLRRDLVRVVEMEVDPQRVVLLEHLA